MYTSQHCVTKDNITEIYIAKPGFEISYKFNSAGKTDAEINDILVETRKLVAEAKPVQKFDM